MSNEENTEGSVENNEADPDPETSEAELGSFIEIKCERLEKQVRKSL
jgi:hypothetical protein